MNLFNQKGWLLLVALLLSFTTLSAQQLVTWDELETTIDDQKRTVYYSRSTKTPLDGFFQIKKGLDHEVVTLRKGLINGAYKRFRSGELREEGQYDDGRRIGRFVEYYAGTMVVKKETPMTQGKIDGVVRTYFKDGKLESERNFKMSQEHGKACWFDHATGQKISEAYYENGKRHGDAWMIVTDGRGLQSKVQQHYHEGLLQGPFREEITQNGTLIYLTEGEYREGKKVGTWTSHDYRTEQTSTKTY